MRKKDDSVIRRTKRVLGMLLLVTAVAAGQSGGPGGPPPDGGPPFGGHGPGHPGGPPGPRSGDGTISTMRGGLQLGPPGRWWDDSSFAKTLGLRQEQKEKMDAVFNANKGTIFQRFQSLQLEESRLEDLTHRVQPEEASIFDAIDRVSQARSALEKANAHMLLLIRHEMDQGQIERLEQQRNRH